MNYPDLKTFADVFHLMAGEYAGRVAFRWVDEKEAVQERTYGDFCTDIRRASCWLSENFGEESNPHVAILARNSYDYAVNLYSCLASGYIVVPLNLQKSTEEIFLELHHSDTDIVLHDGEFIDRETDFSGRFHGQLYSMDAYRSSPDRANFHPKAPDELACIYFTSGTTGRSKGVMIHQKAILASYPQYAGMEDFYRRTSRAEEGTGVTWLMATPLYHVIGFGQMLCATLEGGTVNLNTNARYFFRDILLMPSQVTCLTPVYIQSIQKKLRRGSKDFLGGLNTICYTGAPIQINTLLVLKAHGIRLMQAYGLTEVFSGVTLNCSQEEDKLLSIGRDCAHPLWKDKCSIIDSELCICGDSLMLGYYKEPDATAEVMDSNGWFHTGDLARVDTEGYYFLTGRKKNLIILSGGENVNPEELEELLLKNDRITETVVRECSGKIVAEIFCEMTQQPSINAFVRELNRTIPLYKHISEIKFRDTPFERTSTGKIKR